MPKQVIFLRPWSTAIVSNSAAKTRARGCRCMGISGEKEPRPFLHSQPFVCTEKSMESAPKSCVLIHHKGVVAPSFSQGTFTFASVRTHQYLPLLTDTLQSGVYSLSPPSYQGFTIVGIPASQLDLPARVEGLKHKSVFSSKQLRGDHDIVMDVQRCV